MFRHTITFLLIFLTANHEFAAARTVEFIPQSRIDSSDATKKERDLDTGEDDLDLLDDKMKAMAKRSHWEKRSFAGLARGALAISSGGAFALSTGSSIYHAVRECKDYRPTHCKSPTCKYLPHCPHVCRGPDKNRKYVESERKRIKNKLTVMDGIQRDAFNLATKAIDSGLYNKRIFIEIDRINQKVDELTFSIAQIDIDFASKLRNSSIEIRTLLRNKRLSLDDIVSSAKVDGLFDKWTWEGTGTFVLSLALPISLYAFKQLRQRHAINQIYKEHKADFSKRFVNQKTNTLNRNAKLANKFAYVQGISTKNINKDLKATAKAIYKANQANKQVSKVEKITNNVIGPLINLIVSVISAWSTYKQIENCQQITNDMQDTAIEMAEEADSVEKIKRTRVDALLENVTTNAWPRVKRQMTRQTTLDWLDSIRNLSLGAANSNCSVDYAIQNFIYNIRSANYDQVISLQEKLVVALKSIDYDYTCLADKQNAITTVIKDCRIGRLPFPELYAYAATKHKLNVRGCISKGIPYTNQKSFFKILKAIATHQGWYTKCLLNNKDLLYRVCSEKLKGYDSPSKIMARVNRTGLTEDMILNFFGRCPPPEITPKSRKNTCHLHCLYQPVDKIAKTVVLLEDQVKSIIKDCPYCSLSEAKVTKICNLHFCKGSNAITIEKEAEVPLKTIEFVLANNCSGCKVIDPIQKKTICFDSKCRGHDAAKISTDVSLSEGAVKGVLKDCGTILPVCVDAVTASDKTRIYKLDCYQVDTYNIPLVVDLLLNVVEAVLALTKGQPCPPPFQQLNSKG